MKNGCIFALTTGLAASIATATDSLDRRASQSITSVTIAGNAFYIGSNRFYIRGVDYQPGGSSSTTDPIADEAGCNRDIPEFTKLGINTIRVYAVDNTANHDACMNALAAAGIYLVLDTNTPLYSLNRNNPSESYNSVYLQSVFATIDAFHGYNNTLAFLSGNEVINDANNTNCAPYVKAVTRDMKAYISARGYRRVPVGYSAADVASNQQVLAEYLNCGPDNERSDFYAINDYSWCDPSSFTQSGWSQLVQNYTNYGIPLFMSEYGCITNNRTFEEVSALYNQEMTIAFSGGLVYEYSQEGNGYGLVTISGNSVVEDADFGYLQTKFADTANPTGNGGASSTSAASTCPAASSEWTVSNDDLPAIPTAAYNYFSTGAGTGPGLTGAGSQNSGGSGTESPGTAAAGSETTSTTTAVAGASSSSQGVAGLLHPIDIPSWLALAFVLFATFCASALV